jgi:CRP-like cAMP-binding protein
MFETRAMITASARLAKCLLRLAEKWGEAGPQGAVRITQPVSQSDLGEFAGIARENVNRCLKTWTRDGLLSIDNGCITIVDPAGLEGISED